MQHDCNNFSKKKRNNKVYWFAVSNATHGEHDVSTDVSKDLCSMFDDFSSIVRDIIQLTPDEKIIRNDVSDLKRLDRWSNGPICLLGDAAHATTPNMGQGGAQGIEDAYYMSNILAREKDPKEAFHIFEKERRAKVDNIVNTSWIFGKLIHNSMGQELLKLSNKLTPDRIIKNQMQKLYSIKMY